MTDCPPMGVIRGQEGLCQNCVRMVTRARTVKYDNGMPENLISISAARIAFGFARSTKSIKGSARAGGAKNEQLGSSA